MQGSKEAFSDWAVGLRNFSLDFLIEDESNLQILCPRLLAVSAPINFAIRLLTLARSSAAIHFDVTIGADPSLVFLGAQSGSKLDSSSIAILVISSSPTNSSFSLFLCSSLLHRYSTHFSLFTFTSIYLLRSSECSAHTTYVNYSWYAL